MNKVAITVESAIAGAIAETFHENEIKCSKQ
jgi:hypothetical protein